MSAVEEVLPLEGERLDPQHPWPGLAAFEEDDRLFFHGRAVEIRRLVRLLLASRLVVLYGASGLGKTSLLKAGLFPRLRPEDIFPVLIRLDHGSKSPPLAEQVRQTIAETAKRWGYETPELTGDSLWEDFHRIGSEFWSDRNRLMTPVLIFDQLEEIFTLGRSSQAAKSRSEAFLAELADLVEGRAPTSLLRRLDQDPEATRDFSFRRHPYKVVLSLREDYLAELEGLEETMPSIRQGRIRLKPMTGEAAMQAVIRAGSEVIEPDVAEDVVRYVAAEERTAGTEGLGLAEIVVEPSLLSLVCHQLNQERIAGGMTHISSELLKGKQEAILTEFYQSSLEGLPPAAPIFVEERLLTVTGYRDSVAWENAVQDSGLTEAQVIELVRRRLLRSEDRGRGRRIELTHDRLIGVVRESRRRRHEREALESRARQQAEELEERRKRQEAELQAQRIGLQEREIELQRSLIARKRKAQIALGVLALVAIGAALWAAWQTREVDRQRQRVRAGLIRSASMLKDRGDVAEGMAFLAHAVKNAPADYRARAVLLDMMLHRNWPIQRTAVEHGDSLRAALFGPDGRKVVTLSSSGEARLWLAIHHEPRGIPLEGHDTRINDVTWAPDGELLATGSDDCTVGLFRASDGQLIRRLPGHQGTVLSVAFSADGRLLVSGASDHTARIWDVTTGTLVAELEGHTQPVLSAVFSPDGIHVATGSVDTNARLWSARTGELLAEMDSHRGRIDKVAFSADGERLLTVSRDQSVGLWSTRSPDRPLRMLTHPSPVTSATFSPDGSRIATASDNGRVSLWTLGAAPASLPTIQQSPLRPSSPAASGSRQRFDKRPVLAPPAAPPVAAAPAILEHPERVVSVRFSPDGRWLVTASSDGAARIWDVDLEEPIVVPLRHQGRLVAADFDAAGRAVLTASTDDKGGKATVWDVRYGAAADLHLQHPSPSRDGTHGPRVRSLGPWVRSAHFSPDGSQLLTAAADGRARLWTTDTGEVLIDRLKHTQPLNAAVFSPDGRFVLTASDDGTASYWDLQARTRMFPLVGHTEAVIGVDISPSGAVLATASADGSAALWRALDGERLAHLCCHTIRVERPEPSRAEAEEIPAPVRTIRFSPDGKTVVTTSDDRSARLWDTASGEMLGSPLMHEGLVNMAEFSSSGRRLVTASYDSEARLWDVPSGRPTGQARTIQGIVYTARFDPAHDRFVTASIDGTAQIWDADSGEEMGPPMLHAGPVYSASFSPDGRRVLTLSEDRTARIWDAARGLPLSDPISHHEPVLFGEFSPSGDRIVTVTRTAAHLWDVPPGARDDSINIAWAAEILAGLEFEEMKGMVAVERPDEELRKLQAELADRPPVEPVLDWILADRLERTISPGAAIPVRDYCRQPEASHSPQFHRSLCGAGDPGSEETGAAVGHLPGR